MRALIAVRSALADLGAIKALGVRRPAAPGLEWNNGNNSRLEPV